MFGYDVQLKLSHLVTTSHILLTLSSRWCMFHLYLLTHILCHLCGSWCQTLSLCVPSVYPTTGRWPRCDRRNGSSRYAPGPLHLLRRCWIPTARGKRRGHSGYRLERLHLYCGLHLLPSSIQYRYWPCHWNQTHGLYHHPRLQGNENKLNWFTLCNQRYSLKITLCNQRYSLKITLCNQRYSLKITLCNQRYSLQIILNT